LSVIMEHENTRFAEEMQFLLLNLLRIFVL